MEVIIESIGAYGKDCVGCQRHGKDIMIAYTPCSGSNNINDLFLTQEQAKSLVRELNIKIRHNEEGS